MQISELNNNLVQALAGHVSTNVESKQDSPNFVDFLPLPKVDSVPVDKKQNAIISDSQHQDLDVDNVDKAKDSSNPQRNEKSKDEKTQASNVEKSDTQSEQSDTYVEAVVSPDKAVVSQQYVDVNGVEVANQDDVLVDAIIALPVVGEQVVENIQPTKIVTDVEGEVYIEEDVALSTDLDIVADGSLVDEVVASTVLPQDNFSNETSQIILNNDEQVISNDTTLASAKEALILNVNSSIEKNSPVEVISVPEQIITAEKNVLNDNVILQEEKIAELLPDGANVAIEVKNTKDKISVFNEKAPVVQVVDNIEVEDLATIEDVVTLEPEDISVDDSVVKESQITTVNVEEVKFNDTADINPVVAETDVDNVAVQVLAGTENIRNLSISNNNNQINDSFKDIYNKGLTREIAEQIKVNITQSAIKGVDKIEIKLKPAELGQLEIKMQIAKDGRLQAHIIASNAETLDMLQKDLSSLKNAFENAGYQTDDSSFSFGYHGEEQNNSEREQLRNFIGEVIAQDVAEELAANDYISADGVNIRV